MISYDTRPSHNYCCEDISKIENYDKAINDKTQVWQCHHRLESEMTHKELKEKGLYYNRPASELIFLTRSEHVKLHHSIKPMSEETKQKISKSNIGKNTWLKGKHLSEDHKKKISKANSGVNNFMYGKHHTEETKAKMRRPFTEEHKQKLKEAWKRRKTNR